MTDLNLNNNSLDDKLLDSISDIFIPIEDPMRGWFYKDEEAIDILDAPLITDYINTLLKQINEIREKSPDLLDFVLYQGSQSYRSHRIVNAITPNKKLVDVDNVFYGEIVTLRRISKYVPDIFNIGLDLGIVELLGHESLSKGGIIVLAGETGNGKSTTCAATILHRVKKFGKYALTLEDPPELPLHGKHGNGRIVQTEVIGGGFGEAMKGAMRSYPSNSGNILYVGETRDAETAVELLKAANNGHLVITTTHANSIPSIVKRLSTLASDRLPTLEVNDLLGANIRLLMHQRLKKIKIPGKPTKYQLLVQFLFSHGASSLLAQAISNGRPEELVTPMQYQETQLKLNGVEGVFKS